MRIVGPSSLGVINTAAAVGLNATFSGARVHAGALAIGAQAVAPGIGVLGHAQARQMGISTLVSIGGHADVPSNDLLEWCEADDQTSGRRIAIVSNSPLSRRSLCGPPLVCWYER
ncbi:MAG: hypothetical protein ACLP50_18360 [Solirubrobacteraceae bacterium]